MAKTNANAFMKLPADVRANLEKLDPDIKAAEAAIGTLKKLGMDVSMIEDKLKWARQVKETLLSEFS